MDIYEELYNLDGVLSIHPTGSRYICDPPVMDTDEDLIVLFDDTGGQRINRGNRLEIQAVNDRPYEREIAVFKSVGFEMTKDVKLYHKGDFLTYRRGHYNLITCTDPDYYYLWVKATQLAKERNILDKEERIKLFKQILGD